MHALSIRQPWAYAITHLGKDVENRRWRTRFRGEFLIHAGLTVDYEGMAWIRDNITGDLPDHWPVGGIVGCARIVDCVDASDSRWFFGPHAFVLADAAPLPLKPLRGMQGFFHVPEELVP